MNNKALRLVPTVLALAVSMAFPVAQAAVNSEISIVGSESQWWNTYKVSLTNTGSKAIELRDAKIVFDSNLTMSSPSWSAAGISYPNMSFSSNAQGNVFKNTLALAFDNGSWVKSQLPAGQRIELTLGVSGVLDMTLLQDTIRLIADDEVGEPELSLKIASPMNGAEFEEGQAVTMLANVTATNTTIKAVTFFVDNQQVARVTQAPFQANWLSAGVGPHTIKAMVESNSGLTQEQAVSITVKEKQVEPPLDPVVRELTFVAPTQGQTLTVDQATTIQARVDGDLISTLEFWANDRKLGQRSITPTQTTYSYVWTPNEVGNATLKVVVLDQDNQMVEQRSIAVSVQDEPSFVSPEVSFISPANGSKFEEGNTVAITVRATDADDDLSRVIVTANNQQICEFNASTESQYSCNWTASQVGDVTLEAVATDAQNLTSTARVSITVEKVETPTPPPTGGLCAEFNVYPDWTRGDHATGGDIMVHKNIAYSAVYWTQSIPGSDSSWSLHLNCDGTEPGTAPALSLRNPMDPVRLEVAGWPNTFVVASPSTQAPNTLTVEASSSDALADVELLTRSFVSVLEQAENVGTASIVIQSDVLDLATRDKGASFGTVAVKQALTNAIDITGSRIDIDAINALSDDVKGWAHAHNLIFTTLAPQATFGWSLSIGEFAYDTHSGRQSVWDEASVFSADLLDSFELYKVDSVNKADFVAFTKSSETAALTSAQWHHALEFVKQVTDYVEAPAMLANMPTEQTANYFMGNTQSEQQIRKAAYSNVFALMFDQDSPALTSKIELYQTAKVPLY